MRGVTHERVPGAGAPAEAGDQPVPGVHGITSPKKKKHTKSAMSKEETERVFGEATNKWVQTFSQLVPLEQLDVGIGLAGGQIRLLAEDQVHEALKGFQQVPPTKPIDVTVWNPNLADPGLPPTFCSPYPPHPLLSQLPRRGS